MGLDISHNTWSGGYSSFMTWRSKIAFLAGLPPLELMEGFYSEDRNSLTLLNYKFPKGDEVEMYSLRRIFEQFPIKWECLKPSPLHELLYHSDCDGYINWKSCGKIADELEKLLPLIKEDDYEIGHIGNVKYKTETFISGLRLAAKNKEKLQFS